MFDHKIIVTGSVGVGKSTAVQAYSTGGVVNTDVNPSDNVQGLKDSTTVAMDYGAIALDAETKVHLYGTPGQERFDFMWEILSKGSRGIIILVSARAEQPVQDLRFYLLAFADVLDKVPVVVGLNQVDGIAPEEALALSEDLTNTVRDFHVDAEVLAVDVRQRKDVNKLVKRILFSDKLFAS